MLRLLLVLVCLAIVAALFLTTAAGKRLGERLGLPPLQGRAPRKDREFLAEVCGGDRAAVRARLARERERFPDATDAELHRKAIRTWFREKDG